MGMKYHFDDKDISLQNPISIINAESWLGYLHKEKRKDNLLVNAFSTVTQKCQTQTKMSKTHLSQMYQHVSYVLCSMRTVQFSGGGYFLAGIFSIIFFLKSES